MRRKVYSLGRYSHVIALPRKWVQLQSIEKTKSVEVSEQSGKLLITKSGKSPPIDIHFSDLQCWSLHFFSQLYQSGEERFLLHDFPKKIITDLKKNTWNFPGTKIVKNGTVTEVKIRAKKIGVQTQVRALISTTLALLENLEHFLLGERASPNELYQDLAAECELLTRTINKDTHVIAYSYLHSLPMSAFTIGKLATVCMQQRTRKSRQLPVLAQAVRSCREYLANATNPNLQRHLQWRQELYYETLAQDSVLLLETQKNAFLAEKVIAICREVSRIACRDLLYDKIVPMHQS